MDRSGAEGHAGMPFDGAALLRALIDQTEDHAIFLLTPEGRAASWNPGVGRLLGYDAAEFIGQWAGEIYLPEEQAAGVPAAELQEAADVGVASDDRWLVRKDGSRVWVSGLTYGLRDAAGRLAGYGKIMRDLTRQKEAQDALAESELALRLALAAARAGTWRFCIATRTQELDTNLRRIVGVPPDVGRLALDEFLAYVHPDDRAHFANALERAATRSDGMRIEFRVVRPDGTTRWLRDHGEVLLDAQGRPEYVTGTALDVTEHRATEERLRQSQRMDAVGQLAGGVAHEVNNMMSIVLGFTEELLREFPPGDRRRSDLEQVRSAAGRAAMVTSQLLAFSRRQLLQPVELGIEAVVEAIAPVLTRVLGPERELVVHAAPDVAPVRADRAQVEQLLINLTLNARDAMRQGGRLTIDLREVELDGTFAARHPELTVVTGRYAMLTVSDTGHGMDPETLSRIFEPFFTSKPVGEGTGLGLATVYGIVKQSGGYVLAESEPGQGATFRIYFPTVEPVAPTARRSGSIRADAAAPPPGGDATILIVDDEPMVRRLLARLLGRLGYRCVEAADGLQALGVLQERRHAGEPVDLVVTDLVMPHVNGRELAEQLARIAPELPILFVSGYTDDEMIRQELLAPDAPFLQKPFTAEAIADKLRALLAPRR